jgi:myo-inositol 2-dehydrogenase/D-chiro-inositol 1-dehydrogenase
LRERRRVKARVAIAGCGRMGRERASAALQSGARIVAVADTDRNRSEELARTCGADVKAGVADLPWPQLDAVFVCTPPAYRREAVVLAAQHGVAILVEKPLALGAQEAQELAGIVERAQIPAWVGYMNRYRPGVRLAREFAQNGDYLGLNATWAGRRYGVPWWESPRQSGGPINEQATHMVDLLRYLRGDIRAIHAFHNDTRTQLAATVHFEAGGFGTIFYTCDAPEKRIHLEVLTQRGFVRLNGWDLEVEANTIDGRAASGDNAPFVAETSAFLTAALRREANDDVHADFRDACRTQAVVDLLGSVP